MGTQVIYEDMPSKIKGFTIKNGDDTFTTIINGRLNAEQQRSIFLHELKHINDGDFDKDNIDEIELSAHKACNY